VRDNSAYLIVGLCIFFLDNYRYLIVDEASRTCLAVDPADAKALHNAILKENLMLSGILTT